MTIIINDDYKIEVDSLNYTLMRQTYKGKTPTGKFRVVGYYTSVAHALESIARLEEPEYANTLNLERYIQILKDSQNKFINLMRKLEKK